LINYKQQENDPRFLGFHPPVEVRNLICLTKQLTYLI